jgi:hypothetical protein
VGTPAGSFASLDALSSAPTDQSATSGFQFEQTVPNVSFNITKINPPSNLYIATDDILQIAVNTADATVTLVEVHVRMLTPDGNIGLFVLPVNNVVATRVTQFAEFQLQEGFILSAVAVAPGAVPVRGSTYVSVSIKRPPAGGGQATQIILGDYISALYVPSWPTGRLVAPTEGPGRFRSIQIATPPAGADFLTQAPLHARWRVLCLFGTFGTSAQVANRQTTFFLDDGAAVFYQVMSPLTQAASLAFTYSLSGGVTQTQGNGTTFTLPAPTGQAMSGLWRIGSSTNNIQTLDQWTNLRIVVEEWLEV